MIKHISVDKLYGHFDNPRKDLGDLTELTKSIKRNGILQNLTVVKEPRHNLYKGYIVIIGHRRLAAAKMAGLETVPCIVVEMTEEEQIATMLTENMQREDLTVYEQAQGFQMMLDLGESVSDIAEKTGFSDTTVRRRVKLLDLDQEKFKESESRNVTLQEYASLEKIKDLELRNKVLEYAGTPNFNNELKRAVEEEESQLIFEKCEKEISTFAKEIEDSDGLKFIRRYDTWDNEEIKVPEDAEEENYFYQVSRGRYWAIFIYKEEDEQGETEEERIARAENEARVIRVNNLKSVENRARELRFEFAKNIPTSKAREVLGESTKALMHYFLEGGFFCFEYKDLERMVEQKLTDKEDRFKTVAENITKSPEDYLFIIAYSYLDDGYESYHDYQGRYEGNEKLDMLYDFLKVAGYEMSDEEKAMQDGTHEFYEEEEE